jgi:hypothetical protein|tara:strand:+ start:833 stop:991 length:159 start_codon:yes stop_codon:yes gene_type:complete
LREFLRQSKETILGARDLNDLKESIVGKESLNPGERQEALKKQNAEYNAEYK